MGTALFKWWSAHRRGAGSRQVGQREVSANEGPGTPEPSKQMSGDRPERRGGLSLGLNEAEFRSDMEARARELRGKLLRSGRSPGDLRARLLREQILTIQERLEDPEQAFHEQTEKLTRVAELLARLSGELPPQRAAPIHEALRNGEVGPVEAFLREILAQGQTEPSTRAEAAFHLGILAEARLDFGEAFRDFHHSAELVPEDPRYLFWAGSLARRAGAFEHAHKLGQAALAIRERELGSEHPDVGQSLYELAALYCEEGRVRDAESAYKRALSVYQKALGAEHPDVAQVVDRLAALYRTQRRFGESEPLYRRALAIRVKALGAKHPRVLRSLNTLARLYFQQGQYDRAESLYRRVWGISEKDLGAEHPSVALALSNLAALYYRRGRYEDAEPLCLRALSLLEKALGSDHPDTVRVRRNLVELQSKLAGSEEADGTASAEARAQVILAAHDAGKRISDIVRELNETGVPSPTGKPWTHELVSAVLRKSGSE
jgi:tetratricopeptide (TPR) repeat protein